MSCCNIRLLIFTVKVTLRKCKCIFKKCLCIGKFIFLLMFQVMESPSSNQNFLSDTDYEFNHPDPGQATSCIVIPKPDQEVIRKCENTDTSFIQHEKDLHLRAELERELARIDTTYNIETLLEFIKHNDPNAWFNEKLENVFQCSIAYIGIQRFEELKNQSANPEQMLVFLYKEINLD